MQFWNELEGQVFDARYPLRRLMRSEGRTAWFETTAADGQRATISLTESLTDVDEVAERLEAAQRLSHPNLLAISKVSRARFDNTLFVYAVMEYTEQNLADVLREQPLSKDDAQQLAEALTGALAVIHGQGLLHGRVEPASVVAVGETVKLRSDCLQTPGSTRAGDLAGIGATLFQALTQRKAETADDAQLNRLPAPFPEIVRNSLSSRWGLAQIAGALRPNSTVKPAASKVPAPAPSTATPASGIPASVPQTVASPSRLPAKQAPAETVSSVPPSAVPPSAVSPSGSAATAPGPLRSANQSSPPTPATAAPWRPLSARADRLARHGEREQVSSRGFPRAALYAVLACVLLVLIGWLMFRPKSNTNAANSASEASSSQAAPSPDPGQNPDSAAAAPSPTKPPAVRIAPGKEANPRSVNRGLANPALANPGSEPAGRPVWRVIAFTYNRQDQAQHKADEINQQHSDLRPSVFSVPKNGQTRFLVTLGGPMDRGRAAALRDKAASMGLPADTYIQNFSQ